ncbi:MAG: hypothetical protein ACRDHW_00045 [Ktedonobacteraceae bacterium]
MRSCARAIVPNSGAAQDGIRQTDQGRAAIRPQGSTWRKTKPYGLPFLHALLARCNLVSTRTVLNSRRSRASASRPVFFCVLPIWGIGL